MSLRHLGFVDLPAHSKAGGFDHAAVHEATGRIYVAHTANDAVDMIDIVGGRYVGSITGLTAVAGALVATEPDLVLTSNRGENTMAIIDHDDATVVERVAVGVRPNGLAYEPRRGRALVAHVGDPALAGSCTVAIVDVRARKRIVDIPVAGRTRWAVYDPVADAFHVNVADPPQIVTLEAGDPPGIRRVTTVSQAGPHGLDIDVMRR
jgi:DNA-binding beta-propeller fold protein YncE